ncbi:MAG: MlaD family protein [Pseudomonadota bacterium]
METKANYLIIGVFTLVGLLGSLVFLLWLAKVEVDRQYAYYDVLFDDVSGLGSAGDVRYNGLPVGKVVDLALDPDDSSLVRVRIEIAATTPIKIDTVATLQSQGVTGVSFVGLSGGSPEAAPLPQGSVIQSQTGVLQSVLEGAPVLMQRAVTLLENVNDFVDEENRIAVQEVLGNLASASGRLDTALQNFETLSSDLSLAATEIATFSDRLDGLADTADVTLSTATETLTEAQEAFARGATALATADRTFRSADEAFVSAQSLIDGDVADFVRQGTQTASRIEETLDALETPARSALTNADIALSEAGKTFATANRVLDENVDDLVADVRAAVGAFNTTVTVASQNIGAISAEVLAASKSADEAFVSARTLLDGDVAGFVRQGTATASRIEETLDALEAPARAALATADATLTEAGRTFASANRVLDDNLEELVADVREAVGSFNETISGASENIDVISQEVLAASKSAANFAATLESVVVANQRQISRFLQLGLPEFLQLTEEGRQLVRNLDRFVERLDRDPARYFLGTQGSEFTR